MDNSFNGDPDDAVEVPELTPMEDYDADKAKVKASISWLLCKAFQDNVPEEYTNPVQDHKGGLQLKPVVASGLTSADLYCKACANIFREQTGQWKGHLSVMQSLSRKGVYVVDPRESAVTEMVLCQASPVKLTSHLAVIDALMTAYCKEVVSIEKVVQAVRKFATVTASNELPYDVEDALLFWVNKVCCVVRQKLEKSNKATSHADRKHVPKLEDLLKDINDGCCLGVLISFYCPESLKLHDAETGWQLVIKDLALKDVVGIADSLYNLQEVLKFCRSFLPRPCLHLTLDDLFYTNENLKPNVLTLLAELFYLFEIQKADCVKQFQPRIMPEAVKDAGSEKKPVKPPTVPISSVTKKSFQSPSGGGSHPDLSTLGSASSASVPPRREPLLPRRLNRHSLIDDIRRSRSLTSADDRETIQQSVQAWEEGQGMKRRASQEGEGKKPRPLSSADIVAMSKESAGTESTLLSNVSIDSEHSSDGTDGTLDMSDLDFCHRTRGGMRMIAKFTDHEGPNPFEDWAAHADGTMDMSDLDYAHRVRGGMRMITKFPEHEEAARKKAAGKEGARNPGPAKTVQEPLMPTKPRPAKEKGISQTKQVESGEKVAKKNPTSPVKPVSLNLNSTANQAADDSSGSTTPDDAYQTPSFENAPPFEFGGGGAQPDATSSPQPASSTSPKQSQAFFVNMDQASVPRAGSAVDRHKPAAQSFTLHNQVRTPEAAMAAGIPVVDSMHSSRSDDIMRSSSESSDQELRKIHADHRDSENKFKIPASGRPGSLQASDRPSANGPVAVAAQADPGMTSPKTSFAELGARRMNGAIPQAQGQNSFALTGKPVPAKPAKKTTFGALPNQTSWVESAQKHANKPMNPKVEDAVDSSQPVTSDLMSIRMRLEERRRQIESERRRMELQRNKQRQRVGKQAFMQVISQGKGSESKATRDHQQRERPPREKEVESQIRPEDAIECEEDEEEDDPNMLDLDDAETLAAQRNRVEEAEPDDAGAQEKQEKEARSSQERIRDEASHVARSASPDVAARAPKQVSREGIQDAIENVKKKWFGVEDTESSKSTRKQELSQIESPGPPVAESSPRVAELAGEDAVRKRKDSKSSSGSDAYNTSLEKLNTSLSELQGEIMKLSIQQAEIKNLATESIIRTSSSPPVPEAVTKATEEKQEPSPPRQEQQSQQARSESEPEVSRPVRSSSPAHHETSQAHMVVNSAASSMGSQMYVPPPQQMTSQYPPQPFVPPGQMPYGAHHVYGGVNLSGGSPYMMHPQYPAMQYQPPPMYQQSMYPAQILPGTAYPVYPSQAGYPPLTQPQPQHYTQSVPRELAPTSPQQSHPPTSTHMVAAKQLTPAGTPQSPPVASPITSPTTEHGATFRKFDGRFFISFDTGNSPRRAKPKLGQRGKDKDTPSKKADAEPASQPEAGSPADKGTPPQLAHIVTPPAPVSPGVGFVVGEDTTAKDSPDEMERKKREILEKQQKRREEQEKKRKAKEAKMIKKKLEQQQKQEEAEKRKADEKARREAIYEKYLQKKSSSKEGTPETDDTPSPAVRRKPKAGQKKKGPRPKSCYPALGGVGAQVGAEENHGGSSSTPSHSSQEDLRLPGNHIGFQIHDGSPLDSAFGYNLFFGGLTHRTTPSNKRPPSPMSKRPPSPLTKQRPPSPGTVDCGRPPDSGTKLFVKPSQKSNRNIIHNAISHCCLAGTVNQDIKNRVLEELGQSEAKHFLILFRDTGQQYRALYTYYPEREDIYKIQGTGPRQITNKMIEKFYKYNSGAKSFSEVTSTKHVSVSIDAVTIQAGLWQKKQPASKRPTSHFANF